MLAGLVMLMDDDAPDVLSRVWAHSGVAIVSATKAIKIRMETTPAHRQYRCLISYSIYNLLTYLNCQYCLFVELRKFVCNYLAIKINYTLSLIEAIFRQAKEQLYLIVFRIVVLILQRSATTARVLVLLFRQLAVTAKLSTLIGLVPLLIGIVDTGASRAALILILRHDVSTSAVVRGTTPQVARRS